MMKKKTNNDPTLAEGINTDDVLNESATEEEIKQGEYTQVITLSLDENNPS
ncbi:hypothetical protein [Peribacillus alkalitolerans]|uniref:hypothetical protein n=1 Tax=Peribacillus alkalitolerans TaxID=1550385 RepID=UPI001966CF15|nr:hypothetical protein [Peribacillus alkalitolerans]